MYNDNIAGAGYLNHALNPVHAPKLIDSAFRFLSRRRHQFDGIVVRGVSGMLIGSPVAYRLKMPIAIVRKEEASHHRNHSGHTIEGSRDIKRYVIIDDMISSGNTIDTIVREMELFNEAKPVGIILYNGWVYKDYTNRWNCWNKTVTIDPGDKKYGWVDYYPAPSYNIPRHDNQKVIFPH